MKFYELETEFSFGKYEGKSLQEILEIQPSYIQWCIDNLDHFYISDQVIQKIKSIKPDFRLNQDSLDRLKEKKELWDCESSDEESFEQDDYDPNDDIDVLTPQIAGHNLKNKLGLIKFGNNDNRKTKIYT